MSDHAIQEIGDAAAQAVVADSPPGDWKWATAQAAVPARRWTTLGVLEFPRSVGACVAVIGAVGVERLEDVHLWCPAVYSGWLPLPEFTRATRTVQFSGPVAVWGRNVSDRDVEVDVRFRFVEGTEAPSAPDATAAYYASRVWRETSYLGVQVLKHPCDLWAMQEIFFDASPDLVIETGTFKGGSALYYCKLQEAFVCHEGDSNVVTIDTEVQPDRPRGPVYLSGSSVSPEILDLVRGLVGKTRTEIKHRDASILVVLDSDHSYDHVLAELRAYAPLVSPGSYLVCEDTNTPGPFHAVADFLASPEGSAFEVDRSRERFGSSFNKGGFLKKARRSDQ